MASPEKNLDGTAANQAQDIRRPMAKDFQVVPELLSEGSRMRMKDFTISPRPAGSNSLVEQDRTTTPHQRRP